MLLPTKNCQKWNPHKGRRVVIKDICAKKREMVQAMSTKAFLQLSHLFVNTKPVSKLIAPTDNKAAKLYDVLY